MYKENFHQKLTKARKDTGYTQQYVADVTGITRGCIAKYEIGTLEPDIEKLATLAQFYNVSLNWLLSISIEPEIKPIKKGDSIQRNKVV